MIWLADSNPVTWPECVMFLGVCFVLSVILAGRWWSKDRD